MALIFQNVFSRNTKCAIKDDFRRDSRILSKLDLAEAFHVTGQRLLFACDGVENDSYKHARLVNNLSISSIP